jgi:hypothetical protein
MKLIYRGRIVKKSMVGVLMGGMVSLIAAVYPAMAEKWVYIGKASTGEEISVDADSISSAREGIRFTYSIGNETLQAAANCNNNTWYVLQYDTTYSPQSQATQDLLGYVCQAGS